MATEKKKGKKKTVEGMVTDPTIPIGVRMEMLRQVALDENDDARQHVLGYLIESATAGSAGSQYVEKTKELAERISELKQGPMRCATFDRTVHYLGTQPRAQVILPDGGTAFCAVPDDALAERLQCGDTVWLDAQGTAVLYGERDCTRLGEEGKLERLLSDGDVEVTVGELGRYVFRPTAHLLEQLEAGDAEPGSALVVCQRQRIAWRALPPAEGEGHLRYLSNDPVPDVRVGRDVGAPPAFIEEICGHVERELVAPEIAQRLGARRSCLLLATGVAGSGKSHSIKALWRRIFEVMSEVTSTALEDLPQRVLKLESEEVLSKWLGDTDHNIRRFFDEVAQVAGETFVAEDGREWELPVLVICEEVDALARQRGEDSIHDRIQTTLLTKLDPAQALYQDRLVIVVCTTNIPSALDVAFVRRAGGTVATFDRLGRFEFRAILAKHLRADQFEEGDEGRRAAIHDLTSWLYAPNSSDPGQVEITFVSKPNPEKRYRRDFVTAGLIDRAVQQAVKQACDDEFRNRRKGYLTRQSLEAALDEQVRGVVDQLTPGNCDQYLTLPDAMRVGTVRRIAQPAVLPARLERAS